MLAAFASALKTPDLRKKILFTLAMVAIYRLGATVPSPGVSYGAIQVCIDEAGSGNDLFTVLNLFSGGALLRLQRFRAGHHAVHHLVDHHAAADRGDPAVRAAKKQGQAGQAKLTQYTRYLTIGLGILQSTAFLALAINGQMFPGCSANDQIIPDQSAFALITLVLTMTAGTAAIMWMGELITDRGIGNGMSILIFTSIAARIPAEGKNILDNQGAIVFSVVLVLALAIIAAVVFVEQGQRRLPVQYAKRMIGRKMYGGTNTYLPLKVNQAGVIPVIFATSLLYLPLLLVQLVNPTTTNADGTTEVSGWAQTLQLYVVNQGSWVHILLYFALIIFFTYFYVGITFNPTERAEELRKYGGFIPGSGRAGRPRSTCSSCCPGSPCRARSTWASSRSCPTCSSTSPARATTRTSRSAVPLCSSWSASGWIRSNRSRPS